jgi:hypothetical protein
MTLKLAKVEYDRLNARQQEAYNFQKLSGVLADFGYVTIRLTSDWRGADFIAQHIDGTTFLKVQLKGRLTVGRKYQGRDLYVAFRRGEQWYLFPHDEVLEEILKITAVSTTKSWLDRGGYSFPTLSKKLRQILEPYRLPQGGRTNVMHEKGSPEDR